MALCHFALLAWIAPAITSVVSGFAAARTGNDVAALRSRADALATSRMAATTTASRDDRPSSSSPPLWWECFRRGDYYVWRYTANNEPSCYERYEVTDVAIAGEGSAVVEIEMATHFPPETNDRDRARDEAPGRRYDVHHRMRLDLVENLAAVRSKEEWRLLEFNYKRWCDDDDGPEDGPERLPGAWEWRSATATGSGRGGENVQAFEEKFDCFTMLKRFEKKRIKITPPSSSDACNETSARGEEEEEEEEELDFRVTPVVASEERRLCLLNKKLVQVSRTERHRYTAAWYGTASAGRLCGVALAKQFEDPTYSFTLIEYGNTEDGCDDGGKRDVDVTVIF